MKTYEWYQTLIKPSWAPPAWLFGPVWTVLYVLIAASYGYVGYLYFTKKIRFNMLLIVFILFNFYLFINFFSATATATFYFFFLFDH